MSSEGHKVQRILLELTNPQQETYVSDEKEFSELVNNSLGRILEELLDEAAVEGTTIRIPKLDLDLGTIRRPFRKEEILSLFRQKLKAQLQEQLENSKQQQHAGAEELRTELGTLLYFLRTGSLPWWASTLPAGSHFKDHTFITELKEQLLREAGSAWIERLVNQFHFNELEPVFQQLSTVISQEKRQALHTFLDNFSSSPDATKRRLAHNILKRSLNALILEKGNLPSLPGLLSEFISKDAILKQFDNKQLAEYFGEFVPERSGIFTSRDHLPGKDVEDITSPLKNQELKEKENALLHYLHVGSLPKIQATLSRQELVFLLTELMLKSSPKLREQLLKSSGSQEIFTRLMLELPAHHFKTLVNALRARTSTQATLKEQLLKTLSLPSPRTELKSLASTLLLNQLLKKEQTPSTELYTQSQSVLSATEKTKLREFLAEADPEFEQGTLIENKLRQETEKLDAAYFSDLLSYLIEHRSWPWWGNRYIKLLGDIHTEDQPEKILEQVFQAFEKIYPAAFREFSKELIHTHAKPSLLLSRMSPGFARKLADLCLPFFKNSFSDTVEALLHLIAQHTKSGLHTTSVTQQLIFFHLDQKNEAKSDPGELIGKVLTALAVRLDLALREVYSILVKNYKELALKQPLNKEEALSFFVYDETLEDEYVDASQFLPRPAGPVLKTLSDIPFISGKDEKLLSDYIFGNDSALKVFPSPHTLGQFITERLANSPALLSTFKDHLTGADQRTIQRLLLLEELSDGAWVAGLLPELEERELLEELPALFRPLALTHTKQLRLSIRAAFIKEKQWKNQVFNAQKLKGILKTIAALSGISVQRLEYQLLQELSSETERASLLKELFKVPASEQRKKEEPAKPFVNQLKELGLKKQLRSLEGILQEVRDAGKVAELLAELRSLERKETFLAWLDKVPTSQDKKELVQFIEKAGEDPELVQELKAALEPRLEAQFLALIQQPGEPVQPRAFTGLLEKISSPGQKQALTTFLGSDPYPDKQNFEAFVSQLPEFPEKNELLKLIRDTFPERNFVAEHIAFLKAKQKETYYFWKEKLALDIKLTDELIYASFTKQPGLQNFAAHFEKRTEKAEATREHPGQKGKSNEISSPASQKTEQQHVSERTGEPYQQEDQHRTEKDEARKTRSTKEEKDKPGLPHQLPGREEELTGNDILNKARDLLSGEDQKSVSNLQNLYHLSPEGIADIALYFFFHFELPWWSPVKEIQELETLLRDLSRSNPAILRNKFIEGAQYNAAYFQEISSNLAKEQEEAEPVFLTKEEVEEVLQEELNTFSLLMQDREKEKRVDLENLIPELLLRLRSFNTEREELGTVFTKALVRILRSIDQELFEKLAQDQDASEPSYWSLSALEIQNDLQQLENQYGTLRNRLTVLEEKHNPGGPAKGISVTENIFAILDPENNYSEQELSNTWLHMLELLTGKPVEETKQELAQAGVQATSGALSQEKEISSVLSRDEKETSATKEQFYQHLRTLELSYREKGLLRTTPVTDHVFSAIGRENIPTASTILESWLRVQEAYAGETLDRIKEKISNSEELREIEENFQEKNEVLNALQQLRDYLEELEEMQVQQEPPGALTVIELISYSAIHEFSITPEEILSSWLRTHEASGKAVAEQLKGEVYAAAPIQNYLETSEAKSKTVLPAEEAATTLPGSLLPYTNHIVAFILLLDRTETLSAVERSKTLQMIAQLLSLEELKADLTLPFGLAFSHLESKGFARTEISRQLETLISKSPGTTLQPFFKNLLDLARDAAGKTIYKPAPSTADKDTNTTQASAIQEAVEEIVKQFRSKRPVLEKLAKLAQPDHKQEAVQTNKEQPYTRELPETSLEGRIYVPNAGLVLLWPFLSRLFANLGYTEKGQFKDTEKQLRAVHLSQYLVGFTEDHPEYTLILNKLICGMPLDEPIERSVDLTGEEKQEARNLVSAVLTQWKEMNNTSPENFQRTFLQREGVIWQKDGNWYVKTEHTPFDVLLLKLPWGLSVIKYPWNDYLIFVEWKAMN